MKIAFMGTPEFAKVALEQIFNSGIQVCVAYTQAPKTAGRGHNKLKNSQVHLFCDLVGIPVRTPKTLKNSDEEIEFLKKLNPDVIVVAAYGLIIPKSIIDIPKYGCINIHASILPRWRGAAPIYHALLAGDKKTGITIMQVDSGVDTGKILMIEELDIDKNEILTNLESKLSKIGAKCIINVLNNIEYFYKNAMDQDDLYATYANKIKKEDEKIDWNMPAVDIERKIRALNSSPLAFTEICKNGKNDIIKIVSSNVIDSDKIHYEDIGKIINKEMDVVCGKGVLRLAKIKPSSKNEMSSVDFLRGNSWVLGEKFN